MNIRKQRGISMAETLVATAIFTLISAGVLTLVSNTHRSYANEHERNDVVWQGRAAVDLMVRELRMAGYPPSNTYVTAASIRPANSDLVATTFLTAMPTQVVFEADLDENGIVERVEYRLSGTTLERSAVSKNADGTAPPPEYETLAENVSNGSLPLFTYTPDPLSLLPAPANTQSVEVRLALRTANPDPVNRRHQTYTFEGMSYRENPEF